ncbi:hypothetical protein [Sphaerisporangium siamense]|uniref:Uncharacterized protein n=1 Tax=Sphaerisporangium siamense TaxID=795645 RepID=A0A7W7D1Y9_9ACTN|nr:hypothetical protein [Sphaerisporangium siamense]MBB4698494.1 hypothetical protein [Sphaerisporangium siamense]
MVVLQASPGAADTDNYIYTYECLSGPLLPATNPKKVDVQVAVPKSVPLGQQIPVEWTLTNSTLAVPRKFPVGGKISVRGILQVSGLWQGQLDSLGTKDQGELAAGGVVSLPTAITGAVATSKVGKLTVKPGDLVVDFQPPAEETLLNNTATGANGPITYAGAAPSLPQGGWSLSGPSERPKFDDYQGDVHHTTKQGDKATVTFYGTGLQYITERHAAMGKVEVTGTGVTTETVDASVKEDKTTPVPVDAREFKQVLWQKNDFTYGEHTVTFTNKAENGKYMLVDAFKVSTDPSRVPSDSFRTTCSVKDNGDLKTATVEIVPAPSASTSSSPSTSGQISDGDDSARGVVVLSGGGQGHGAPTATATATVTPKPTKKVSSTPQVRVTPKGGAHTGEAPERNAGAASLLIGYGAVLTAGGLGGGLLLRRRRMARGSAGRGKLG